METDENCELNVIENRSDHLANNNNSIQTQSCLPEQQNGFNDTTKLRCAIDTTKPNIQLIGENVNCDTDTSDCNTKSILNNNDLAIGFVDDDDETNVGETSNKGAANADEETSQEAAKGHTNDIG